MKKGLGVEGVPVPFLTPFQFFVVLYAAMGFFILQKKRRREGATLCGTSSMPGYVNRSSCRRGCDIESQFIERYALVVIYYALLLKTRLQKVLKSTQLVQIETTSLYISLIGP